MRPFVSGIAFIAIMTEIGTLSSRSWAFPSLAALRLTCVRSASTDRRTSCSSSGVARGAIFSHKCHVRYSGPASGSGASFLLNASGAIRPKLTKPCELALN